MRTCLMVLLSLALIVPAKSQASSDILLFKNGKKMTGKVLSIKTDTVEFEDSETGLKNEIDKGDIKNITLANGKVLDFDVHRGNTLAIVLAGVSATALLIFIAVNIGKQSK